MRVVSEKHSNPTDHTDQIHTSMIKLCEQTTRPVTEMEGILNWVSCHKIHNFHRTIEFTF